METKAVPIKPEAENQKTFGVLRCPKPGCGKTLFEMEKSFWIKEPQGSQCRKCSGEMVQLLSYYNEKAMGQLVIRFWCPGCSEEFDRKIPSIRKYCHHCKSYMHLFFYLFIGIAYFSAMTEINYEKAPA